MSRAIDNLQSALARAMAGRPKVGGFPYLAETLGGAVTFFFFAVMMVLQFIFVWRFMPETKGRSLEQIETNIVLH